MVKRVESLNNRGKRHERSQEAQWQIPLHAGDIVGALASKSQHWKAEGGSMTLRISFMLNGRDLGTAFTIGRRQALDVEPVPLQPQISQLPAGLLMHVRLRGTEGSPLAHPKKGFLSLVEVGQNDFCPFSQAVAEASIERTASSLTQDQLRDFCVPDAHVVELYDVGQENLSLTSKTEADKAQRIASSIVELLKLPASLLSPPLGLIVRGTTPDMSTALVAFRRASHAQQLTAAASSKPIPSKKHQEFRSCSSSGACVLARPLQHATSTSREKLREWRGEAYRPQADPTTARRLIHGSLKSQMPLAHLIEERNLKNRKRPATA
ncbi:unnamed protein product [Polarella glacialis]|uniref:Uncharacterized protein n=1 Tax=Polarella glacialis TaxID=89957 RepID=A0A813HEF2_POLGL|nr:unnamed protein product [Polarella glacialis]